jgi:3-phenylpropionate/trans-cinnamate dioxygenase ferredoxin reductase subunit
MASGVVIVGGGQAGFQAAASLRSGGYAEPIRIVGAEPHHPYQRPPLSKSLLLGKTDGPPLFYRQPAFYAAQAVDLLLSETVTAIDPAARRVELVGGSHLSFDALLLATGARVRTLPIEGAELDGVLYLRTLDEAQELRSRLLASASVAVIGGGFIGLEVAAAARMLGREVTVIEVADRLMGRVVAPVISEHYRLMHKERGVEVVLGARPVRLEGEAGRVRTVLMEDGMRHPADLVVVGIGVQPNAELAAAAGLPCGNGIAVDERARTTDPAILAAGDCALHPNRFARGAIRLESVQNAVDQARAAAATILGQDQPYDTPPWFWTDQYEAKLQMVGISLGHDASVLRGDPASGRFSVFYFAGENLIAIDSVNRPGDHLAGRKMLAAGTALVPAEAADEGFDLKAALLRG